jgi:hypothetical protein
VEKRSPDKGESEGSIPSIATKIEKAMYNWIDILYKIKQDPRYQEGITYGVPRKGHDEGSVSNHIVDLEKNLLALVGKNSPLLPDEGNKLRVLIHVHDTFKLAGKRLSNNHQVSLRDPRSHAMLGRAFLNEFTRDESMLAVVQYHDEGHALWQQQQKRGKYSQMRMAELLGAVPDIELYAIFTVIDGYTPGKLKDRTPRWFLDELNYHAKTPRAYAALSMLESQTS